MISEKVPFCIFLWNIACILIEQNKISDKSTCNYKLKLQSDIKLGIFDIVHPHPRFLSISGHAFPPSW